MERELPKLGLIQCNGRQVLVSFESHVLREHLSRIFNSSAFRKSKRLIKLLNYVAWRSFNENPEHIRAYEIALEVFEKGINFDPNDPYIRNIAGLVRKALEEYYRNPHSEDFIKLTLPAGDYKVQFTAINTPELVISEPVSDYVYPDQKSHKTEYVNPVSKSHVPSNSEDIFVQLSRSPPTLNKLTQQHAHENVVAHTNPDRDLVEKPLLAVIPFSAEKNVEKNLLLGEVLAGALIRSFSPTNRLDVMSRLSTTQFKALTKDKIELHHKLRADYILAGNYRVIDDEIILTIELSTLVAGQSKVIWSDVLIDPTDQILSKESQLLGEIVRQTCASIERHEILQVYRQPQESISVYRLIISAINYMHCGPEKLFNQSLKVLQAALELDKNNPEVNALIANWHIFKINRSKGWKSGEDASHQKAAEDHCTHALAAHPSHAFALTIYGFYKTQFDRDLDTGLSYYRAAQKFDPNEPLAHALEATIHGYTGAGDEAVKSSERAIKLSPFDPQLHMFETCRAAAYLIANKLEQAEIHARNACVLNANHTSSIRGLISILVERGKIRDAETHASKLLRLDPGFTTSSYLTRAPCGGHKTGKRIAESLRAAGIPAQ